jgi:hypothetical protein
MEMDNRRPRSFEARENTERNKSWQPPSVLPTPNPVDGYTFRWVRTSLMGAADHTNVSARFREGWEPVKLSDHPELKLFTVGTPDGSNVEVGGLTLCKMPSEFVQQRASYYSERNRDQLESVEQSYMRENDRRMAKFSERN